MIAALMLCLAGSSAAASVLASRDDTGDRAGLALLGRVREAYAHVPAVTITGSAKLPGIGLITTRFTQVLRKTRVVAEEADLTSPGVSRKIVKRLGMPTYVRDSGQSCWIRVTSTDPRDLTDVGLSFLGAYKQVVGKPTRSGPNWLLPSRATDKDGTTGTLVYTIDRTSFVVRSASSTVQGEHIVEYFHSLTATPRLATPTPRC